MLDGVVDIWMPDLKYAEPGSGCRLSGVDDYPQRARDALAEMYRQVNESWEIGPEGELRRGLLVRMLVLPGNLAGIEDNLRWLDKKPVAHRRHLIARPVPAGPPSAAVSCVFRYQPPDHTR